MTVNENKNFFFGKETSIYNESDTFSMRYFNKISKNGIQQIAPLNLCMLHNSNCHHDLRHCTCSERLVCPYLHEL